MPSKEKIREIGELIEDEVEQAYFDEEAIEEFDQDERIDILCGDNFERVHLDFLLIVGEWNINMEWFFDVETSKEQNKVTRKSGFDTVGSPEEAVSLISEVASAWEDGDGY